MTVSQFDKLIDRTLLPTMKWDKDQLQQHFSNADAVPFWVADMDFQAPSAVIDSLVNRAEHGIYGYEYKQDDYFDALINWYKSRHNWEISRDHIESCPSVLNAIAILINQHSNEGDGIIVQPPVFFEFRSVIKSSHRQLVKNPLKLVDGKYQIDFDDLEAKVADPNNKILIICNPHNPVGRVWTREELTRIGEMCLQHNVLVISDEIHGDIVYHPYYFTPFGSLSDNIIQNAVVCISPAKTFNIAGMVDANVVIPNDAIRTKFHEFAHQFQINKINIFASAAIETAYQVGGDWLDELLIYLQSNVRFIQTYLADNLPQVKLIEPEGTYLVWLDFRDFNLDAKDLEAFLGQDAGLALNSGYWFGREGAGFARMNIACPRSVVHEGLERLTKAVSTLP